MAETLIPEAQWDDATRLSVADTLATMLLAPLDDNGDAILARVRRIRGDISLTRALHCGAQIATELVAQYGGVTEGMVALALRADGGTISVDGEVVFRFTATPDVIAAWTAAIAVPGQQLCQLLLRRGPDAAPFDATTLAALDAYRVPFSGGWHSLADAIELYATNPQLFNQCMS